MLTRSFIALALLGRVAHADRTTNVQVDVFGVLEGRYALTLDHAITSNAAISVELSDSPDDGLSNRSVMLALPVFASHVFRGFFVAPGVAAQGTWANTSSPAPDVSSQLAPQVVLGWAWLTASGLSIAAAIGVKDIVPLWGVYCDCTAGLAPTGYVRVGYAF
jgi:hypothetical protein